MSRRRIVTSFDALLAPFSGGVNALCFARSLDADFDAIARALAPHAEEEGGILTIDEAMLRALPDVDARAAKLLLADIAWLTALGREPQLNVITRYPRDDRALPMSVDVHSFHVDRAPVEADTFLCTYAGASSEGLDNDDAIRRVDEPEVRAALRAACDGDFDTFVTEGHFDLHFAMKPGARPYDFGAGHLWRLAVDWPGARVPPCIHRAPSPDGRPRLLLIS